MFAHFCEISQREKEVACNLSAIHIAFLLCGGRVGGYIILLKISAPGGEVHKIFESHRPQKYCWDTLGYSWFPYSKGNSSPLKGKYSSIGIYILLTSVSESETSNKLFQVAQECIARE